MNTLWVLSSVLQWAVIVALSVLVLSLVRQFGVLSLRLNPSAGLELNEGPGPGSEIPAEEIELFPAGNLLAGGVRERPLLIVSLSPDCSLCTSVARYLRALAADYATDVDILVVVKGTPRLVREFVESHSLGDLPVALAQHVPKDLWSHSTPAGLVLTSEGTVAARGVPNALEHLEEMVRAGQHGLSMDATSEPAIYPWGESLPIDPGPPSPTPASSAAYPLASTTRSAD
jgi:methylamine dehydrogenase accessory protein MauD